MAYEGFWSGYDRGSAANDQRTMMALNQLGAIGQIQDRQAQIPLRELALRQGQMGLEKSGLEMEQLRANIKRQAAIRDALVRYEAQRGGQVPQAVGPIDVGQAGGIGSVPAGGGTPSSGPMSFKGAEMRDMLARANIYAREGDMDSANKLREHAVKLAPELFKVETQTGPDGKPRTVQFFKGGETQAVEGFTPAPKLHWVNQGDRTTAVNELDPTTNGRSLQMFQSPDNRASTAATWGGVNNARARLEFDKLKQKGDDEALQYLMTDAGIVGLPKKASKTGDVIGRPVTNDMGRPFGAPDKPLNDSQAKALLYASRMQQSENVIETLAKSGTNASIPGARAGFGIGPTINVLSSADQQSLNQAKRNFINATLRRESGAVISQPEFENGELQYFPQVGDSKQVIAQKAANRKLATEAIMREVPESKRISVSDTTSRALPGVAVKSLSNQELLRELAR